MLNKLCTTVVPQLCLLLVLVLAGHTLAPSQLCSKPFAQRVTGQGGAGWILGMPSVV